MKTREDNGVFDTGAIGQRLRELTSSPDASLIPNQPDRERLCAKLLNKMMCEIRTLDNEVRLGASDDCTICEMCAKISGYAAMLRSEYEVNDFPLA